MLPVVTLATSVTCRLELLQQRQSDVVWSYSGSGILSRITVATSVTSRLELLWQHQSYIV